MPRVRISNRLAREITEYLRLRGELPEGPEPDLKTQLETCLALLFYGTDNLPEGRDIAKKLIQKTTDSGSSLAMRGKVAAFAEAYQWDDHKQRDDKRKLAEQFEAVIKELEEETCLVIEPCPINTDDLPPPKRKFKREPWKGLKRIPLEELHILYPRHKLLEYAELGELQKIAVEAAFAALPSSLRRDAKVFQTYRIFMDLFNEYKETMK